MNSDMDHGGTDTDAVTHCCIDNSSDKPSAGTYDMVDNSAGYRIESIEHDKLASLHNPNYTDTFSSVGSDVPLLAKDKNKIWEESEEDIPGSTRYKYNPEESDADRLENQTSSRLLPDVQNDDDENDYLKINIQKYFDETQGKNKEFNVSVVEIVPHIPHDTDDPPWESTAYIDEYSCASPSTRRLERVCKNAMLSLSQDLSCKSSMKGSTILPVIINQISDQPKVQIEEAESFFEGNEIKNLLVMSISVALMNAAFSSLRNLQSSLNHEGGIGLYSLTGSCGAFTLLSIFTPSLIQQFRPKKCFLIALCTHLLFVAANVIPEFYIMVPASILQGAGAAVLWNAISTYITYLARSNAIRNDKRTVHIASKYFGIFFCFFQLSVVVGNMISSVVLFRDTKVSESTISKNETGISNENSTLELDSHESASICGAKYCHSYKIEHETVNVESNARYNLLGIYGVATVLSLVLPMLLMDHLKNYRTTRVSLKRLTHQATAVLRCILDVRFLSCFIIFLYSNMELGFVMAEITKAFITCPLGIHMVGYTMICFGLCGSISSFIGGRIEKYVGNVTLISIATIIHLVLLAVLLTWVPDPDQLYIFFIILGAWGVGDGIWISQVNCVVSSLFPNQLEEAFASLRVVNGLGMTIGFAYSSSLCMSYKMYILFAVCLSGTVVYVASEIIRRYRADKVAKEVDDEDKY